MKKCQVSNNLILAIQSKDSDGINESRTDTIALRQIKTHSREGNHVVREFSPMSLKTLRKLRDSAAIRISTGYCWAESMTAFAHSIPSM